MYETHCSKKYGHLLYGGMLEMYVQSLTSIVYPIVVLQLQKQTLADVLQNRHS